jgi:hypothetical protein
MKDAPIMARRAAAPRTPVADADRLVPVCAKKGYDGVTTRYLGATVACREGPMQELLRPWKLVTFALGTALMIYGATLGIALDWDVGISLLMPTFAYVTAPWCVRVLLDRRWRLLPLVLLTAWVGIDGIYTLYWSLKDPQVLLLLRDSNFTASAPLYALCGMGWFYRGSLADLRQGVRAALKRRQGGD